MKVSFGLRLPAPERYIDSNGEMRVRTMNNVPVENATPAQQEAAVSLRVICSQDEIAKAKALLMRAKTKLGYEGEVKEGTFRDGTPYVTLGRRASADNGAAFEAMLG